MACAVLPTSSAFYVACCQNNVKTFLETVKPLEIDKKGPHGTALHAASFHGHVELVRFLLRYHADREIQNDQGLTAQAVAKNDETRAAFEAIVRTIDDSNHFVASSLEVEWLDSYKNAYRISYENHEHMKRWLTKIPLKKLLEEIDSGYVDKIKFTTEHGRALIKEHLNFVIDEEDPLGLVQAYTDPRVQFHLILNHDLAEVGSDFRFVSTQALINSGYLDNEAPKGLGQYIFASILINHPRFRLYYHAGMTYRGMNITRRDLQEYEKGKIVMTRSFLSTSKKRERAELFLRIDDYENRPPVLCIYKVTNPRSSLNIQAVSQVTDEEEVLIVPFTVFEVISQQEIEIVKEEKQCLLTVIELDERSNPV